MGKEFIEYTSKSNNMPYKKTDVLLYLTEYAKYYIRQNNSLISEINPDLRDSTLVDFINYIGLDNLVDFALCSNDLYDTRTFYYKQVDPQCLLTLTFNYCAYYIFKVKMTERENRDIYIDEQLEVLIDFLNYIAKTNGYDRVFKLKDLHDKFEALEYKNEMEQLKSFLELTSAYSKKLISGLDVDDIFNIECLIGSPKYHFRKERNGYTNTKINKNNLYALAYAYEKLETINKKEPRNKIIIKKINEMKEKR